LLLLEQVAYLATDDDRLAAFRLLERSVGTDPEAILAAPMTKLHAVARRGGSIAVTQRAARIRQVAERSFALWGGARPALGTLSLREARRELTGFPAIGQAGADRIILLTGARPVLGLDSNALRVLQRLGYAGLSAPWARAYREAQEAAERELPATVPARRMAFLLLRRHGQTVCRRSTPDCGCCPLLSTCPAGASFGRNRR
jgi:endonuclease III